MFALFEAGLQRNRTGLKPHAASLRSLHGANHVAPLRGAGGPNSLNGSFIIPICSLAGFC